MAKLILECRRCRLTHAEYLAQARSHWSGLRRTVTACIGCQYRGYESAAQSAAAKKTESPGKGIVDRRSGTDRRLDAALYSAKTDRRDRDFVDRRGGPDRGANGNSGSWVIETSQSDLHLIWQDAYECGNPVIDREHRQLFELANAAMDASFGNHDSPDAFRVVFNDVIVHLKLHFAHEEALLEQHDYLRLKLHKAAHKDILTKRNSLNASAQLGLVMLGDLLDFTITDVARHLVTMDMEYFPLFKST